MDLSNTDMILRIALAAGLGTVLGIEREFQQKTAGLRTHTLVAAGACLFTIAGVSVASETTDLSRVAAQVVVGIGFIGAGGMIRSGFTISGITTAATLWFAAALGVAAGFGLVAVAVAALAIALVATLGYAPVRSVIRRRTVRSLEIEYEPGHGTLGPLFETLNAIGAQMERVSMTETDGRRVLRCDLVGVGTQNMNEIVGSLRGRDEVVRVATVRPD